MKQPRSICNSVVLALITLIAVAGCGGPERSPSDETPSAAAPDDLRVDPLALTQDREVVPDEHPRRGQVGFPLDPSGSHPGSEQGQTDSTEVTPLDTAGLYGQIFRVQLEATQLYAEAQQVRRVAEEIFDRPVYVDYEVPYFKVRVGDFADRYQAEDYLMNVKAAGFDKAWVAMVNLMPQMSDPNLDSLLITPIDSSEVMEFKNR